VHLEVADALRELGWEASFVGPSEVAAPSAPADLFGQPVFLREYLRRHAAAFDVVEYEHHQLPFPRADFPPHVLFVARSVLLTHCQATHVPPLVPTLRGRLVGLARSRSVAAMLRRVLENANLTMAAADLVNVCNDDELAVVRAAGHTKKALLLPFGLTASRRAELGAAASEPAETPIIAFIGTFDPRKGMAEFADIVKTVLAARPDARFKLIGTGGLVPDREGVLRFFPRALRPRVEVIPAFEPSEVGALLRGSWLGIFPSHCEGFPFGLLELLAAGLPVLAYRAPGAPMLLPDELLVERGAGVELGRRVTALLADRPHLSELRAWATRRATEFPWRDVALATAKAYKERLAVLRARAAS